MIMCDFFRTEINERRMWKLYEKIKSIAKKKNIPIRKLEMDAGISQGSICKWDDVKPSFDKVVKVAKLLGIDIKELTDEK